MSQGSPSSTSGIPPRPSVESSSRDKLHHVESDPLRESIERKSDEVGLETIRPPPPAPEDYNLHALAQRGDTFAISKLLESDPSIDISGYDSQNATALHWAAINAHVGTCRYLLDNGAEVDAIGGDLKATPLQWAARNGHLYVIHLLLSRGADPNLRDAQGFNTLHLITHSSAVMPVLYMLHQPIAIDEKDDDGHTALMWAAYQGDAISVDLLLRHGASPIARDNAGMSPLHWAAVKGSSACVKHLLAAGADLDLTEQAGKTARDMAEELKSSVPFNKGLEQAGYSTTGLKKYGRFSDKNTNRILFVLPTVGLFIIFKTFQYVPIYSAFFLALAEFFGMQILVVKVLLAHKKEDHNPVAASPYFASIIIASFIWVCYAWATRLVKGESMVFRRSLIAATPGHALADIGFFVSAALSIGTFFKAMVSDPGYVSNQHTDSEVKMIMDELVDQGRFNGTNFCITCMAKKPLRSKHDWQTERCVAKFDHYCPWIWNSVGSLNHRYFLAFVLTLISGIVLFDHLTIAHVLEDTPEYTPPLSPGLSICDLSNTLCRAGASDPFLLAVAIWSTIQLTWTSILAVSQLWQVSKQMTTLEVSNLGRYGFMGGRGGSSLRGQAGAMRQATAVGAGAGMMGAGQEGFTEDGTGEAGPEGNILASSVGATGGHSHTHGQAGIGKACKALSAPVLHVLGLDRFTKGKALGGMKRAGRDQNPFDLGLITNCLDFWTGDVGVDYTTLYDLPPEGWAAYRRKAKMSTSTKAGSKGGSKGYQPVSGEVV